jgi:hypothetical protein
VRARVDVLAVAQLAEVDAVAEHRPHAARRHAEARGQCADRRARAAGAEGLANLVGLVAWRKLTRPAAAAPVLARRAAEGIAPRRLVLAPNAGRHGLLAPLRVTVGVLLALAHRVGQVDVADETPVRCARVEVLVSAVHAPAGRFHALQIWMPLRERDSRLRYATTMPV